MQRAVKHRTAGLALAAMSGLLLSACYTTDLKRMEATPTAAIDNPYDKALTEEYRALARYEAREMYDWPDARHFARKGLKAAEGQAPLPEYVARWDIARGQERLNDARNRLAALISAGAKESHPGQAARVQAAYDCWLEQLEEGWQTEHIALCHDRFERTAIQLERGLGKPRMVHFDLNSSRLDPAAQELVRKIAAEAQRYGAPQATVIGHADAVGSRDYNMTLSLRRAEAVRDALARAGLPRERIALSAYGEGRQLTAGDEKTPIRDNRRVEIIFLPSNTL